MIHYALEHAPVFQRIPLAQTPESFRGIIQPDQQLLYLHVTNRGWNQDCYLLVQALADPHLLTLHLRTEHFAAKAKGWNVEIMVPLRFEGRC